MCSPFCISEIKSVNNKPRKREGKEGVLSAAFPSPCSNISSFTFPFPAPRFLLSAVPANRPSSFSLTFHLLRHQQEKPQPQPPCSQLQPEQPPWQGAQGKLANQAQPTLLLTGKVRQSFGELEHPYCMWSFQMNGSAEGAQQLFQAWDCASRPINHSAPGRFS